MRMESGRSLVEIVGVIAIGMAMTAGVIGIYRMMRQNQERTIAQVELKQIANDVKILMETRGDYTGVSVDYLIKAGALSNDHVPIGGNDWSVTASVDGKSFNINLVGLSNSNCAFFATSVPSWAKTVIINGYEISQVSNNCFSGGTNEITFVVE